MKESELILDLMCEFDKTAYSIAALKKLIYPFRVTESSLRANLSRMNAKGSVVKRTSKGAVSYGLSASMKEGLALVRASRLPAAAESKWDKTWMGILFSVPEAEQGERYPIRKLLAADKFACLYPGFWIRPAYPSPEAPSLPGSLHRVIRFEFDKPLSAEEVDRLWNVRALDKELSVAIELLQTSRQNRGRLNPESALIERMTVAKEIDAVLASDPLLPPQLLPASWHGDRIRVEYERWRGDIVALSEPYCVKALKGE